MDETKASAGSTEQQNNPVAFFGAMFNSGAEPVLKAQADLLASVETTMSDWLRRRQEAVLETQTLVTRLRASSDPAELAKAQQEWVSGAFRRLAADAAACQTATQALVDRARGWFPNGIDAPAADVPHADVPAADEAARATRPLRMANRAAE